MKLDVFGRRRHFIDHMIPIWNALEEENKGEFMVPQRLLWYATSRGVTDAVPLKQLNSTNPLNVKPHGNNPLLISASGDLTVAWTTNRHRDFILMEHGVGLVFPGNVSYAGNRGMRARPSLTLAPNQIIFDKTRAAIPEMPQKIIGTPYLDNYAGIHRIKREMPEKPTVCISFHWPGFGVAPEAGNALQEFSGQLVRLREQDNFNIIGHAHPRHWDTMQKIYEKVGITPVKYWKDVMSIANLYVNDASSTLYEFLVTGWPVVIMNSRRFRKDVNFGIRFWDYTDIGFQVDEPQELIKVINRTIEHPNLHWEQRQRAISDLYPYLGWSAKVAANEILEYFTLHKP